MIRIVFEDDNLLIVDKPPGLQTEPDRNNHPNLLDELIKNYPRSRSGSLFLINRLDRPTGGLIVLSKKKSLCAKWQNAWNTSQIRKFYHAVVQGIFESNEQTLSHFLWKDHKNFKAIISTEKLSEQHKHCQLHYKVVQQNNDHSLLEIELLTGRYHQIRAQLSYIGHPVWNDSLYGANAVISEKIIGLYCTGLSIHVEGLLIGSYNCNPFNHSAFRPFEK